MNISKMERQRALQNAVLPQKRDRWAAFRDRQSFAHAFLRMPRFHEFVAMFIIVFWALPELGHQLMLRGNYYGLGNNDLFTNNTLDCVPLQNRESVGKFLGVYPYRAVAAEYCNKIQKSDNKFFAFHDIRVLKPHTFFTNMYAISSHPPYEVIFTREVNGEITSNGEITGCGSRTLSPLPT